MSVYHSTIHKIQFIVDLTQEAIDSNSIDTREVSRGFDADVLATLDNYKAVSIDSDYKRYGLDFGLVSECLKSLSDACHDIAILTRTNPNLRDVEFDAL